MLLRSQGSSSLTVLLLLVEIDDPKRLEARCTCSRYRQRAMPPTESGSRALGVGPADEDLAWQPASSLRLGVTAALIGTLSGGKKKKTQAFPPPKLGVV